MSTHIMLIPTKDNDKAKVEQFCKLTKSLAEGLGVSFNFMPSQPDVIANLLGHFAQDEVVQVPSVKASIVGLQPNKKRGRRKGFRLATRQLGLKAKELEAQKMTLKQIAGQLDVSIGTVIRSMKLVKRRGAGRKPWVTTPEFIAEVSKLREEGYTQDEIVSLTGRKKCSVLNALKKHDASKNGFSISA
jgi:hypothetical protein